MPRMPIRKLCITFCWLPFIAASAYAGFSNFSITIKRETWSGLGGLVSQEGERIKLPDLLWEIKSAAKPEGDVVFPTPIDPNVKRRIEVKEPLAKFEVADPVVLRIRGEKIKFEAVGSKSTTIPSDYDGLYLAYSLKDSELQLTLSKSLGKATEWKVVDAERGMCLSAEVQERRQIELEIEKRYDDHSDGK